MKIEIILYLFIYPNRKKSLSKEMLIFFMFLEITISKTKFQDIKF